MDASQITGAADGAQLNTWTDTSGAANNAVRQGGSSTGYPKYVASGINGKPVVRFNSANGNTGDYLRFNRISTIRSVFWVLKDTGAGNRFLLGDDSTYHFHRGYGANAGKLWEGQYASANILNGTTKLMGSTVNGTTTTLPSGSFQLVSLVTSGNVQANQITQDRIYNGSWEGDIAEILIYDRALTTEEEDQVGSFLSFKYGLQTSYKALPVTSGLVLRMDASKITGTADGAQLNTWTDTSGAANNAVRQSGSSTGYPKYVASGINGKPVVRFNSANGNTGDYLRFNRISTIRSVFWVLKDTGTGGRFLLGDDSNYHFHRGYGANAGKLWEGQYASANILNGTTKLMGSAVNGTTTTLPSGSFQLVSLVTSGNVQANQITQDRIYNGSWQGDIAEILIYNRALTASEEIAVGSYLGTKYGLATNYSASAMATAAPMTSAALMAAVQSAPVFTANPTIMGAARESVAYTAQTLAGKATDVDAGDTLTYSKVSGPVWLTVASSGALSGTPPAGSAGLNSFVVRVTDSFSAHADAGLQITVTGLPAPWMIGSIGSGMLTGSISHSAGTFSQSGSGALGTISDKLSFSYQTLSGDGGITAKISALQDTGALSRVGVMIRETLATNSKYVFMGMSGSNTYCTTNRTSTGGIATSVNSGTGTVPNTWVKLERVGNVVTAYKSTDGTTWTSAGSTTVTMAANCYIGLAVSSGSDTTLNSSQFSNLSVTP
jgi:regulation of enolase protein 1 (concanavalin A-like superfamily)